jgi:hypothetical protein
MTVTGSRMITWNLRVPSSKTHDKQTCFGSRDVATREAKKKKSCPRLLERLGLAILPALEQSPERACHVASSSSVCWLFIRSIYWISRHEGKQGCYYHFGEGGSGKGIGERALSISIVLGFAS